MDRTGHASGVTDVRRARKADLSQLAESLAKAFHDDPVMLHMLPELATGTRTRLEGLMRLEARGALRHDSVWTSTDGQANAIWKPPNTWKAGGLELLRQLPRTMALLRSQVLVALSVLNAIEKKHPLEPHWYLAVLGTEPAGQGKGKGSAVLQPMLDHCDRAGEPAYLESSKEQNVPFYERHGFRVTERLDLPNDGPSLWLMWRDPQPA